MEQYNRDTNPAPLKDENSQELNAKDLIRKHIEDPNHEITDDDIRNVKIDLTENPNSPIGAEMLSRIEEEEEDDDDDDENNDADDNNAPETEINEKPSTPWDVRED